MVFLLVLRRTTIISNDTAALPLSTLLSQVLVAFTIEFDNEFERRVRHRTTALGLLPGSGHAPWLASLVMWSNLMQFVRQEGVTVAELQHLAHTAKLSLTGMERWGYIVVAPDPAGSRPKPPRRDWVVRPTAAGRRAQEVWRPLFGIVEERWQARFGADHIARLRDSLAALIGEFDVELPEYLPVLGYGLVAEVFDNKAQAPAERASGVAARLHLPALLSKVLLAFTIEFERESEVSLAISANVMRILGAEGVRVRDLPRLSGVSKEAIAMALGFLEKRRYVVVEPDPAASRTKVVRLMPKGRKARDAYLHLLTVVEERWQARFGQDAIGTLRESLERLAGEPTAQLSPLFRGLEPHPGGWRASARKPGTLPHYPMVLHRGGFPDGS
jgi:DNA-binding MarR family transcriptional regulator